MYICISRAFLTTTGAIYMEPPLRKIWRNFHTAVQHFSVLSPDKTLDLCHRFSFLWHFWTFVFCRNHRRCWRLSVSSGSTNSGYHIAVDLLDLDLGSGDAILFTDGTVHNQFFFHLCIYQSDSRTFIWTGCSVLCVGKASWALGIAMVAFCSSLSFKRVQSFAWEKRDKARFRFCEFTADLRAFQVPLRTAPSGKLWRETHWCPESGSTDQTCSSSSERMLRLRERDFWPPSA